MSQIETKNLKIAVFYDWLNQWGGAEKVLLNILSIYPKADIFTLVYQPKKTTWLPQKINVNVSQINCLPFSQKNPIFYTPFYSLALEKFDFSSYDIVISTTSTVGHCLLTPSKTLFVCYFHNTNRYLYQTPKQFQLLSPILKKYQKPDFIYSQRPDYLLCNSKTVQNRIKTTYQRNAKIIYPGVDTNFFIPGNQNNSQEPYFLIVSRLVEHKRIDLAIQACHQLHQKLIIVGEGRDKSKLLQIKQQNQDSKVVFLGHVSDKKLLFLYQNCQALICL